MQTVIAYSPARIGLALALGLVLTVLLTSSAYAVNSPIGFVLCEVILIVYGNFGRALATIGVITLGVGAMLGKVSWGLAITLMVGISLVFGAVGITSIFLNITGAGGWICGGFGGIP